MLYYIGNDFVYSNLDGNTKVYIYDTDDCTLERIGFLDVLRSGLNVERIYSGGGKCTYADMSGIMATNELGMLHKLDNFNGRYNFYSRDNRMYSIQFHYDAQYTINGRSFSCMHMIYGLVLLNNGLCICGGNWHEMVQFDGVGGYPYSFSKARKELLLR